MDRGAILNEMDNRRSLTISAEVGQGENLPMFGACASCSVYLAQKHGQIGFRTRKKWGRLRVVEACARIVLKYGPFGLTFSGFCIQPVSWEAPE